MSINHKLTQFAQRELVISQKDAERAKIKSSLRHLETILKSQLGSKVQEFIRFGSFTRNTILPRKYDSESDIDLMILMNTQEFERTPGTYRRWILDTISHAYQKSPVRKDFPTIRLELNHIIFDLVPAYSTQSWLGRNYYIPAPNDQWQKTVPNDINDQLSRVNQANKANIVRCIIRLCKHWNASHRRPFPSYLMEKKIVEYFDWRTPSNTYEGFLSVLNHLAGNRPGVSQALEHIRKYEGGWSKLADEEKQIIWLRRLIPGFL